MKISFSYFIAKKYFRMTTRANPYLLFLISVSIIGVFIGVVALMVVLSVMFGLQQDIKKSLLKATPHLIIKHRTGQIFDYKTISDRLYQLTEIINVSPSIERSYLLKTEDGRSIGVKVVGIDKDDQYVLKEMEELKSEGSAIFGGKEKGVWIGKELADYLLVYPGNKISLVSAKTNISLFGMIPKMEILEVTGIFQTGYYDIDSSFAYTGIDQIQKMEGMEYVEVLKVKIKDPMNAHNVAKKVFDKLEGEYFVTSWLALNRNLFTAIKHENIAMVIIISLVILVASLNISSNLMTIVIDKSRDIAIMKSFGASSKQIVTIFTFMGSIIGAIGTIYGWVVGMIIIWYIKFVGIDLPGGGSVYYISKLPASLDWRIIILVPAAAFVLSIIASIFPAIKANEKTISQVLRYE
ncbi:MAG: ABC transporter permease [Candidatus Hydrogenedentota bacterium]